MAQVKPVLSSDPGPQFDEAQREALEILQRAADEWAQGNPEEPSTRSVLDRVLKPFLDRKFLRRPF
jgi:hypothetical protein